MRIIRKDQIKEPFRSPLGELVYEMIGAPKELGGTEKHSFVHVVIPYGKSSMKHYHKISEETYYILKDRGRLVVNGKEYILKPKDSCLIDIEEVHQIFNDGEEDLEFLTVSAPAWTQDDSYEK